MDNLIMQFYALSMQHLLTMPQSFLYANFPKAIESVGKRNGKLSVFVSRNHVEDFEEAARWQAMSTYAQEPYYGVLLSAAQDCLGGASIRELMTAWSVVRSISLKLCDFTINDEDERMPHEWIAEYVPVIQVDAIARGIQEATGFAFAHAQKIVQFLTYRGDQGQELYSQPLVPVGEAVVSPCLAAIHSPNLRRLCDIWLRQLGVDLEKRGPAFEAHIRSQVRSMMASSPLLSKGVTLADAMHFDEPDERVEEIDLVAVIGELVILGEAKCILQPTEAKEVAMHRKRLSDAAIQIGRKAAAVRRSPAAFRQQLAALGCACPEVFEVLPLIILNNAVHAGFPVDGVPVVDENILEVFFSGELHDAAVQRSSGAIDAVKKRILYDSLADAVSKATDYFSAPPQLDIFKRSVVHRSILVPPMNQDDWYGEYITVECEVNIDADALLSGNSPGASST